MPISRRRRSTAFARLGQAIRQAGARDLHTDDQAASDPHRRSADRRLRQRRQRHRSISTAPAICSRRISRPTAFRTATAPTSRSTAPPDGALHVVMRGDVYDGRGFVKTVPGGSSSPNAKNRAGRRRSRHEARRGRRLQRRSFAQRRSENVAPGRRNPQLSASRPRSAGTPRSPAICAGAAAAGR